jgi:hypothetical protein
MSLWGYMAFLPAVMSEDDAAMQAWKAHTEETARMEAGKQGYTLGSDVHWDCKPMISEPTEVDYPYLRETVNGEVPTAHMWRLTADVV